MSHKFSKRAFLDMTKFKKYAHPVWDIQVAEGGSPVAIRKIEENINANKEPSVATGDKVVLILGGSRLEGIVANTNDILCDINVAITDIPIDWIKKI